MTLFDNLDDVECPTCSATNPIEILYGMPSEEMQHAEVEGHIVLGGCVISGNDPAYQCRACGEQFGQV